MDNNEAKVEVKQVEVPVEAPKMSKDLVIRTIIYVVVMVNAISAYFGFDFNIKANYDAIYDIVSIVAAVITFVHAYWKNNNVTKQARIIDEAAKQLK